MTKQKVWYAVGGVLVGAALVGSFWLLSGSSTLAKVGSEKITNKQLTVETVKIAGHDVLQRMIDQQVIEQSAKKLNITATDAEVNEELTNLKSQFPSEDQFQQTLQGQGMSMKDLTQQLRAKVLLNKIATKDVKISDADVKKYYDEHGKDFEQPEQVHARHILVDTEAEAKAIADQLKKGTDFAQLAKEKSKDTSSGANGGDLGFFGKGQMVPEFDKVVFDLKPNQISDPVKTQFGYHIIQLIEKKDAKKLTLEEARPQIEKALKQAKATPPDQLIPELRKQAGVTILSSEYKNILDRPVVPVQ